MKASYGLLYSLIAAVNKVIRLKDAILESLHHLLNSDEALDFFEAFHALLVYFVLLLAALIGLCFQILGISPVETHFAMILLFIMATIIYSIAYVESKLQTQDADLPIIRSICLISGIFAIEGYCIIYTNKFTSVSTTQLF